MTPSSCDGAESLLISLWFGVALSALLGLGVLWLCLPSTKTLCSSLSTEHITPSTKKEIDKAHLFLAWI